MNTKRTISILIEFAGMAIILIGLLSIKIPDFENEIDFSFATKRIPILLIGLLLATIGYISNKSLKKKKEREEQELEFLEQAKLEAIIKSNTQQSQPEAPQTFTNQ